MNQFLADFAQRTSPPALSEWLPVFLEQPCVRELRPKLHAIVPAMTADRAGFVKKFEDRVFEACYGAFISTLAPDWRSQLRESNRRFDRQAPRMIKAATDLRDFLQQHPFHVMQLAPHVEHELRAKCPNGTDVDSFGSPKVLIDAISAVANAIDYIASEGVFRGPGVDPKYGPIDFGKPVRGNKVRSREQMLAFHLEFLLRYGSIGIVAKMGAMPAKPTQPHRDVVADLVSATLGEQDAGQITAEWVGFSVKGILRDNPGARIEGWPGPGIARLFSLPDKKAVRGQAIRRP